MHVIVPHKPRLQVSCNLGMREEPGSASLPCTTVAVRRGAGAKTRCASVPYHCVWQFYFTPCFRHPLTQICRGAQPPASSVQGGCSPPRSPASYASALTYPVFPQGSLGKFNIFVECFEAPHAHSKLSQRAVYLYDRKFCKAEIFMMFAIRNQLTKCYC